MQPRVDDKSISDDERLWRRIVPSNVFTKVDKDGNLRPSSAAFLDGITGEVSVCRACLTSVDKVLENYQQQGLVEINAKLPRSLGHIVVADPQEEDLSHALICPPPDSSYNRRKKDARIIADKAEWLVKPVMAS
ncbi:hypothetical protein VB780_09455 [Leptolyngbya sp. CCNP1308]|uniref:hypothetical protein n=1 Tax=Leptolyngbya sp. CCNP1308 TaxID=3110255 RepID=UPI002B1EE4D2|nr:hypothetical protein [Leptolyngbya sp. CCNP1308]MEA5448792.1 hypothetical protein [Leptolyngbya sp. CCNP1308]